MEGENDMMFAALGKAMLLAHPEETFEEIVTYLEKDNYDPGNGGFVGDAIYYLFGEGHDVGIRGMKILILKLIKAYGNLQYWYDSVVNRIESYDWFAEFNDEDLQDWNEMKRLAEVLKQNPKNSSNFKDAIKSLLK